MALDITYVPIDDLDPWPGNARRGVVSQIKESMKVNGIFNALGVQKSTNRVIVGNHRLMALRELHEEDPETWDGTAPVMYLDVNDHRANRINIADNKTSDDATWDDRLLAEQLQAILDDEGTLIGTGFAEDELEDLIENLDGPDFQPEEGDTPRLDQKSVTDCPNCGHTFTPTTRTVHE